MITLLSKLFIKNREDVKDQKVRQAYGVLCGAVGIFLNQETQGMLGGFSLASKLGFAVLYMREERVCRGHYRLTFEVISENALGQDPEKLMRQYYDLLEADIVKDPVNWLWSHKRWH